MLIYQQVVLRSDGAPQITLKAPRGEIFYSLKANNLMVDIKLESGLLANNMTAPNFVSIFDSLLGQNGRKPWRLHQI